MQLLHQEKSYQPIINIFKTFNDQSPTKRRNQEKKQIKINKRKLPLDFFKGTVKRSLSRKSPLEQYQKQSITDKQSYFRNQPQTQRKIASCQNLPSQQLDHVNQFCMSKTDILRLDLDNKNSIRRRIFPLEQDKPKNVSISLNSTLQKICPPKSSNKSKQLSNKFDFHNFFLLNEDPNKKHMQKVQRILQNKVKKHSQTSQIDMNCTFGKGFKKSQSFSLQNTLVFRQDLISRQSQISEQIEVNKTSSPIHNSQKKYHQQKSTQQSQIMQAFRLDSPIKRISKQLFIDDSQSKGEQNQTMTKIRISQKSNKIKWSNSNKNSIIDSLKQMELKSSKQIYTSQIKQRVTKNRQFNTASQHRDQLTKIDKSLRKQKRIENLNLPKIQKIIGIY